MSRRLILATCLLGMIGGTAGAALADGPVKRQPHQICLVLAKDDSGAHTQDYCVDWTGVAPR